MPKFEKILVPLDGSALAEAALPAASTLAEHFASTITLVRVVTAPRAALATDASGAHDQLLDDIRGHLGDDSRNYLAHTQAVLQARGLQVHVRLAEGASPAETIVDVATDIDADVIVMSTHGRSGVSRLVFGSIAEKVLRLAEIPVLLLRADPST